MSKVLVTEQHLSDIGDAIRDRLGVSTTYKPSQMAAAIETIAPEFSASDEGKVVVNGALVQQTARAEAITENGTYDTTLNDSVVVNVESGDVVKGFWVHAADGKGGTRSGRISYNNQYFVCYFDDNMNNTYTLNGSTRTFSIIATGAYNGANDQTLADTLEVTNPNPSIQNAIFRGRGSSFTMKHGDTGSHISVVGGWVGYPSGGTIYRKASTTSTNSITLSAAHKTLLVFIGACGSLSGKTSVSINAVSYNVTNNGVYYNGKYGMYGAIVIENNSDTQITVTFPGTCCNFVSVIGLD